MSRVNYKRIILIAIAVASAVVTVHAVSIMMFASLGQTSTSDRWSYIITLQTVLAIIGIAGYLTHAVSLPLVIKASSLVSTSLSGAILGFYYGGTYTDNNSQAAIISAIALSIIFNLLYRWQKQIVATIIMAIAGVCAYGFASMRGVAAINLIAGSLFIPGIIWGGVCLIYLGLTVSNIAIVLRKI